MQDTLKFNRIRSIMPFFCLITVFALGLTGVKVYGASVPGLAVFLCFVLFYVLFPGLLILRAVPLGNRSFSTQLTAGVFTGWAFQLLLYFITDVIRTNILLCACGPLMSLAFAVLFLRDEPSDKLRDLSVKVRSVPVCAWIFFMLVLLYAMMTTQYLYLAPELSDFIRVNPDKAYHMGLIDSLSHDYPLMSLWIDGRQINYHIFTEMLYSIPVRLFGLDADFMLLSCGPFFTAGVFSVSLYSFFAELSDRAERAGLYSLLVILADLFIARSYYNSIAYKFIITNDNAAGFGVAAAFFFAVLLRLFEKQSTSGDLKSIRSAILLSVTAMLATGIKGPIGAVLIAALWGTMMLGWLLRKLPFRYIVPLLLITVGFVFIYIEILGSKGQTNGGGDSIIALANITNICFWKKPLIASLKALGIPSPVRLAIVFVVFLAFYLTAFFLPFCIGYIRELVLVLSGRKDFEVSRVFIYAVFMVGFVAMFMLNYSGHSQIYFGLVSVFYAPLIAFWLFEDLDSCNYPAGSVRKGLLTALKAVFVVSMCITTVLLGIFIYKAYPNCVRHADPTRKYDRYTSISNQEYVAMQWLKEETPETSLLATDRYYSVDPKKYAVDNRWDNRFFLYGTYSNRFCYIAGSGYNMRANEYELRKEMLDNNKALYDAENENRGDDARELGVDYVVVSKRFTDIPSLENEDYELCYSNDEIDIYEIRDAS